MADKPSVRIEVPDMDVWAEQTDLVAVVRLAAVELVPLAPNPVVPATPHFPISSRSRPPPVPCPPPFLTSTPDNVHRRLFELVVNFRLL